MAIVSGPLFDSISGKCGGVVFCKQKNGRIVMRALPLKKKHPKSSEPQKIRHELFKVVKAKFKAIRRDPVELAKYAAKCPSNKYLNNFITSELLLELGKNNNEEKIP